jgi:hypothetical protein
MLKQKILFLFPRCSLCPLWFNLYSFIPDYQSTTKTHENILNTEGTEHTENNKSLISIFSVLSVSSVVQSVFFYSKLQINHKDILTTKGTEYTEEKQFSA